MSLTELDRLDLGYAATRVLSRACVNPGHLLAGSHTDNHLDMFARNRHPAQNRPRAQCKYGHTDWVDYPSGRKCRTCHYSRKRGAK